MRQVLTPKSEDISLHIPKEFVGIKIEVTVTPLEEKPEGVLKPSDLYGSIGHEEGEKLRAYIKQVRKEWDRNI